jgi:ribonuclease BN (tRNA processing enzyme)
MIDFGPTALRALLACNRCPTELRAIVFTHLHGDHIGGFPFLYIDGLFNRVRTEPMTIVGPIGTEARLFEFLRLAYGDIADRASPLNLSFTEIAPGEQTRVGGALVEGFEASHMDPPEQPLCLRLTGTDGGTIAFSGDTEPCPGLFDAADQVDLLVAECSAMEPPAGRHCTWQQWQLDLPKLTAKQVLLTHLGESMRAAIPGLEAPDGVNLTFADDGMIIEL